MESSNNTGSLEQTLQDGNLYRRVNAFIVAHLRDNNLNQAASAVSSATMTPLNVEAPPNKLLELVAKGLAVEKDEMLRGVSSSPLFDSGAAIPAGYGSIPEPRVVAVDFRQYVSPNYPPTTSVYALLFLKIANQYISQNSAVYDIKGASKSFPKHETRHVSEHKNIARCARFSPDGRFLATGSADTSIKLFEVIKIKQMMLPDAKDGPVRPVVRTFYDHLQVKLLFPHQQFVELTTGGSPIGNSLFCPFCISPLFFYLKKDVSFLPVNDIDFHPQNTVMITGAKDHTIKFFDFSKAVAKRAFRVIQDTHNVRSVAFHPSGDFVLAGTDHPIAHLYDVNTFQCYLSAKIQDIGVDGSINQVRYSSTGGMYVTASKDGAIRIWDGVTASCVRSILGAHGTTEAISANFTKDQRMRSSDPIKLGSLEDGEGSQKTGDSKRAKDKSLSFREERSEKSNKRSVNVWDCDDSLERKEHELEEYARRMKRCERETRELKKCGTYVERFVLSCGKDSLVKLWEVGTGRLVKQYVGATHTLLRCQAVFNDTEEFVLSIDEPNNEIVIWDAITAEKVAKWPSNHIGAPRWLEHSPTEAAFVSCGNDKSVRFWKELL
ncbi:hypothetical protein RHSIM_Rhsim08G0143500 [Rhododendron simsii]|uniref:Cleavage stimulation factor 50 kDa subunit n=1 Tax=Rhododendron simsii TaxID=118357 RepID=A0A834GKW3_RHOSS|nr:hypothetical protein RHSIM_Rhsim08G0143500 [Rhododendron simsii]